MTIDFDDEEQFKFFVEQVAFAILRTHTEELADSVAKLLSYKLAASIENLKGNRNDL